MISENDERTNNSNYLFVIIFSRGVQAKNNRVFFIVITTPFLELLQT